MRLLLIAIAGMVVVSGPALACRAVNEYPQAFQRLEIFASLLTFAASAPVKGNNTKNKSGNE